MAQKPTQSAHGATAQQLNKVGRTRMRIGFVLMMIVLLILAGKLILIQGLDVGNMAQAAEDQRTVVQKLPAVRGKIVDSKGHVLAESIIRYDITVAQNNLAEVKDFSRTEVDPKTGDKVKATYTVDEGLAQLAKVLDLNFAEIGRAHV